MQDFEKLGAFYLGKEYDLERRALREEMVLYDAKDLTTHAVCVGMTGSGKTGLCLGLLEEAALDGIPTLAIDPKGDIGNLLLTFPGLRPADFEPWVDPAVAASQGKTAAEYAASRAKLWKEGLADWGQDGKRIQKFRDAVDLAIYTPGSNVGLQLSVLQSLAAPAPAVAADADALRERILSSVSGLLALLGIDADPLRSREYILLANILDRAWQRGDDLDLGDLIRQIQTPPFDRVGVFDLESFYPVKERLELAMSLNNLLASPGFSAWMEGEPLDIQRLLWTSQGKPRIAILSISHLSDAERMFFVTVLLGEVVSWMRGQSGTSALRAILYMDEVFGFFPPTANPPSKTPMLTLLKQARAYGLGIVLATQNPVDLDYKGLSNAGTWFLGRLQTERDKMRVLEGLEGASTQAGASFDRARMEATLAGLGSRVFLMNNVHEDQPVLFQTRWALSYLRGPLQREQIRSLMAERKEKAPKSVAARAKEGLKKSEEKALASTAAEGADRPVVQAGVTERFLPLTPPVAADETVVYRPALVAATRLHFVAARADLDLWEEVYVFASIDPKTLDDPWQAAECLDARQVQLLGEHERGCRFASLPAVASSAKTFARWGKLLASYLYRERTYTTWACRAVKLTSKVGEGEGDFRARVTQAFHEKRNLAVEKLRARYKPKLARLRDRIERAKEKVEREKEQYSQSKYQTALSFGATVLGALFGRKLGSRANVGRATRAARGVGRAAKERGDIARAQDNLEDLNQKLVDLEEAFQEDLARLQETLDPAQSEIQAKEVRARKSDIAVRELALTWTPWRIDADGIAEPLFEL